MTRAPLALTRNSGLGPEAHQTCAAPRASVGYRPTAIRCAATPGKRNIGPLLVPFLQTMHRLLSFPAHTQHNIPQDTGSGAVFGGWGPQIDPAGSSRPCLSCKPF